MVAVNSILRDVPCRKQRRAGGKRHRAYAYVPGWLLMQRAIQRGAERRQRPASPGAPGAADRGAIDKALVGLLFQGGLRRSEAAALRWAAPPLRCERSSADTG